MDINPHNWLSIVLSDSISEDKLLELLKQNVQLSYAFPITRTFSAGTFKLYTIGSLRRSDKIKKMPVFTIYARSEKNLLAVRQQHQHFDTSSLQLFLNQNKSKPMLVQVASNFNCQENGAVYTNLESGHYLRNLMVDSTQGLSASAGAGLGAIERLRTHLLTPINLLSNLSPKLEVINGKLVDFDKKSISSLDLDDVQIGLHTDLSANFDRSERGKARFFQDGRNIDQVFVSTIALKSRKYSQPELQLTRFLLKAAYDGTYLAAHMRDTERLLLTLIGGGVFLNPLPEIISAIARAHVNIGPMTNLREVILPLFDHQIDYREIISIMRKEKHSKRVYSSSI